MEFEFGLESTPFGWTVFQYVSRHGKEKLQVRVLQSDVKRYGAVYTSAQVTVQRTKPTFPNQRM